jgi:putative hydrolase of the HAD superfamily
MPYSTLFFDLDGTLYPNSNGLWSAIMARMNRYMHECLGLPEDEVPVLRHSYYEKYGTTLRGLQENFQVDAEDYLAYVHDLPLHHYLRPAPEIRALLTSLSQKRWIFTNADADHAERVLEIVGLTGCFEGIIDVRAIEFTCKPEPLAYQRALDLAGDPQPEDCVFLDDSVSNLIAAQQMGFVTVLVSEDGQTHPAATCTIPDLIALPQGLPELWE